MAQAWLKAGWESSDVDMEGRKLVLRRSRRAPPDVGFSDRSLPPPLRPPQSREGTHTLTVSGLDGLTIFRITAKAELHGRSIEDMARDILTRGAILSHEERLALADRTRAMSPGLHDIDMVAMIREDRDSR